MTFEEAKTNLLDLRKRWYGGEDCSQEMKDAAIIAANLYNAKAKELAAKHRIRPRLVSADHIMRTIDRSAQIRP